MEMEMAMAMEVVEAGTNDSWLKKNLVKTRSSESGIH